MHISYVKSHRILTKSCVIGTVIDFSSALGNASHSVSGHLKVIKESTPLSLIYIIYASFAANFHISHLNDHKLYNHFRTTSTFPR